VNDLRERLFALQDIGYRDFSMKLTPGCTDMIGVRTPVMKAIAKEIASGDWRTYLGDMAADYQEERVVRGFVICYAKMDLDERMRWTESQVALMDNWAVCDSFFFRPNRKEYERYFEFARSFIPRSGEYERRFGVVTMMKFIDDGHIDEILSLMDGIRDDRYYVRMAVAWTLSVCYVKYPEKTDRYLESCLLDDFTYNKTIQKICESFRADPADKERLKAKRR
jgi:3-methyladenine DNA glycosylase AlkD